MAARLDHITAPLARMGRAMQSAATGLAQDIDMPKHDDYR